MLVFAAALLALLCMTTCLARLRAVVSPSYCHPQELAEAVVRDPAALETLAGRLPALPLAEWDTELCSLPTLPVSARAGEVAELVFDLDSRISAWATAPRTVARVGSIGGFLIGSVLVRQAMQSPLTTDHTVTDAFQRGIASAISAVLAGLAMTAFAAAVHVEAQRRIRTLRPSFERLIDVVAASGRTGGDLS